jgi:pimeloyl-ACP methyl ester carboxylesterase
MNTKYVEQERMAAAAAPAFSSPSPSDVRLERVTAPTLVVIGGKDPDFTDPAEEGAYFAEKTGEKLEVIEGAGHYPQTEMPEKTASIVLIFSSRPDDKRF